MLYGKLKWFVHVAVALLIHSMAHWKIVALYVLHGNQHPVVFSLALILALVVAENTFIRCVVTNKQHATMFIFVHYLTIQAYCLNILLREKQWKWMCTILLIILINALAIILARKFSYIFVCIAVLDLAICNTFFQTIFYCQ